MIKLITCIVLLSSMIIVKDLWECNRCHQQFIGKNPPRSVKCPATDNKKTHWWILKKTDKVSE